MNQVGGIWIQGAGEMASAVAVVLVQAGYRVVMAELPRPLAVRRLVCFSEAVYAGRATVAGIPGQLANPDAIGFRDGVVGISIDPSASALRRLSPRAVIDARLTKRAPVALPAAPAVVIGLGPGFTCGVDADLVIETHRAAGPGTVISEGGAAPDTGVPGVVGGHTSARVLRAPAAGHLRPCCVIGDLVVAGQAVGDVAGEPVISQLDGLVRGLIHERAELCPGMKVGDVDPRGVVVDPRAVSDKGLAIGGGVLQALNRLGVSAG